MITKTRKPTTDDANMAAETVEAVGRCYDSLVAYQSAYDVASHAASTGQINSLLEELDRRGYSDPNSTLVAETAISYYVMEAMSAFVENHKEEAVEIFNEQLGIACAEFYGNN